MNKCLIYLYLLTFIIIVYVQCSDKPNDKSTNKGISLVSYTDSEEEGEGENFEVAEGTIESTKTTERDQQIIQPEQTDLSTHPQQKIPYNIPQPYYPGYIPPPYPPYQPQQYAPPPIRPIQPYQPITQPGQYYPPPPIRPVQPYQPQQYAPPPIRPIQPYQPYQPYQPQPTQPYPTHQPYQPYYPGYIPPPYQPPTPESTDEIDESSESRVHYKIDKGSEMTVEKIRRCESIKFYKRDENGEVVRMSDKDYKKLFEDHNLCKYEFYEDLEEVKFDNETVYCHMLGKAYCNSLTYNKLKNKFIVRNKDGFIECKFDKGQWKTGFKGIPDYVKFYRNVQGNLVAMTNQHYCIEFNSIGSIMYQFRPGIKCCKVVVRGQVAWEKYDSERYPTAASLTRSNDVIMYFGNTCKVYVKRSSTNQYVFKCKKRNSRSKRS
eukprot:XP_764555.1 hypothetical protein [Theileria parva strain Muguga]